ncbi:MAG: hypothetical protein AAGF11_53085 [Myxococcota bacterium]
MTERFRARNTEEAFWALDPFALVAPHDPWYAKIEQVLPPEHYGVTRQLHRRLRMTRGRPRHVHIGILGHRGTGKTTLVRAAMAELPHILPVYIDAQKALDHGDFAFADLVLVAATAVVEDLKDLTLDDESFTLVRGWFSEHLLSEQRVKELVGELDTTVQAQGGLPWLASLMAKFTASLKSQNVYREEIRRKVTQDLRDLVRRMNILLDGAHRALSPRSKTLCVVFDNLEKIGSRQSIDHASAELAS